MFTSNKISQAFAVVVLVAAYAAICYPTIAYAEGDVGDSESFATARQFFKHNGLSLTSEDQAKLYTPNVIKLMGQFNRAMAAEADVEAQSLGFQITKAIWELSRDPQGAPSDSTDSVQKQEHSQALKALELLVPTSTLRPDLLPDKLSAYYLDAKEDLRDFYKQSPSLGGELLDRLIDRVQSGQFEVRDVTRLLRNFYDHWIPLGQLVELSQNQAESKI